ncbi:MAG: hypothetical protein HQL04_02700 [Nitrospirae bacterium]|nr:hypothetical protein [Nitrospirota bacterium]
MTPFTQELDTHTGGLHSLREALQYPNDYALYWQLPQPGRLAIDPPRGIPECSYSYVVRILQNIM